MRLICTLLLISALSTATGCHSQTAPVELSANTIIPNPPPSALLRMWRAGEGRETLTTQVDGVTLRGYRYTGKDPSAPTIIFFNGNGMTIAGADSLYREIAALGSTVVVYDYRGYGFSTGNADLASFRNDGLALYDEAAKTAPKHRVVVYGYSMGTATATYIATQRTIAGLILAAPIASAEEEFPVFGRALGYSPAMLSQMRPAADAKEIFGEAKLVTQSKSPLLVLHGTADQLVPMAQGKEIFAASPAPIKKFVALPGVEHNGTAGDAASLQAVREFLTKL